MQRCNKIRQSGDAGAKQERAGSQAALQRRLAYARTRQATSAHNPLPAPATLRRYLRGRPQRRATTRKLGKLNSELRERERGEMPNKRAEVWGERRPAESTGERLLSDGFPHSLCSGDASPNRRWESPGSAAEKRGGSGSRLGGAGEVLVSPTLPVQRRWSWGHPGGRGFFQSRGGDAESQICHHFAPLRSPPGAKAKAKANALGGTASPRVALATFPGPWPRSRAGPSACCGDPAQLAVMARWRLGTCGVRAPSALLLLLLLRPPMTPGVTCPTPASVEHADIRVKSYNLNSRERYVCNSGFKRKAGTSSLTECVLNKTTNITHWTTPNLKCIRDPSLSHQRPVPPSTVVTAGVTPHPESPSPSGKEPATLSPTVTRETAVMPGSRLVPSKPPSPGTTGTGSHQLSQTTTKTLELTPSTSHKIPGVYSYSSRDATVAISSSVTLLCVLCVVSLLVCYIKSRRTPQPPNVEMEIMEATPMTGETSSPQEDPENYPHNL